VAFVPCLEPSGSRLRKSLTREHLKYFSPPSVLAKQGCPCPRAIDLLVERLLLTCAGPASLGALVNPLKAIAKTDREA
jgi:hypothetical protein